MRQSIPRHSPFVFFPGLVLLLATIFMFSPIVVQAQSASATGRLEGTVTDSTGAAVPGADITVRNQNTGISATVQSSAEGDFTLLYLDPGTYEVSIQKAGFNKLVLKDIAITVGTRAIIRQQLAVGRVETSVSVSATTPLLDTAESSLGTVVDQKSIGTLGGDGSLTFSGVAPGDRIVELRHDQMSPKRLQRSFRAGQIANVAADQGRSLHKNNVYETIGLVTVERLQLQRLIWRGR